ncbi:MAG: MarR family transcriptional regulator [Proteobacteria bacterium]|nr:MAG: MarR family transcriptional regulator [Pseudomonadota bacterium]
MQHTKEGELLTHIILETFKLNGLLITEGDQLIQTLGISSARWKVLGALSESAMPMTVPDIARMMGQSRQAVQRLANEMKKEGLIKTQANPEHKRSKQLRLTESGRKMYAAIMQKYIPWINAIGEEFSSADLTRVSAVLQKLIHRFES